MYMCICICLYMYTNIGTVGVKLMFLSILNLYRIIIITLIYV